MIKIAILSANLGGFDTEVDNVKQEVPANISYTFHRFTDRNFPPVTGLTGRFQYRIPKLYGWQMFPGYDYYLWLDGSMSLQNPHSLMFFFNRCQDHDMALFTHPWRKTVKEEVDHLEDHLKKRKVYITSRYKNGFHKEQYEVMKADPGFKDDALYASTVFMYHNTQKVQQALCLWWYHQSRFYTCDQVVLPYVVYKMRLDVKVIKDNQYKTPYLTLSSKHK